MVNEHPVTQITPVHLHQGWAALTTTPHHAFGDEEHRAAAYVPPDHPHQHPQ